MNTRSGEATGTNPDLIMCGTCGDEFTQHDRGTCGNCMAGETAALHVEIERLTAERDALRAELTALRVQETAASGGPTIVVDLTVGRLGPERDQEGPRGTYGCACVSREARTCLIVRYGYRESMTGSDERCECMCHQWDDDE